ncbi:MAG: hypothetical protein SCARUB_00450 [Candidatus Scalindua rubra]|uniref:Uncharacterized protein n=1 Tax=Candidatus Scalindua rubra TaxID=1872076 RepID=A0A1E3XFS5_9BACT|nr:MAG: hypothetical protein SCARUB_00450 [Candidatus Scalindua rubra]
MNSKEIREWNIISDFADGRYISSTIYPEDIEPAISKYRFNTCFAKVILYDKFCGSIYNI